MTEKDVFNLGFQCVKQYEHDEYYTNRYQKGFIQVEFTYKGKGFINGILETVDITIEEIIGKEVQLNKLKQLDKILN